MLGTVAIRRDYSEEDLEEESRLSKSRVTARHDYFQTFIRTELSVYIRNVQGLSPFSKKIMKFVLKSTRSNVDDSSENDWSVSAGDYLYTSTNITLHNTVHIH